VQSQQLVSKCEDERSRGIERRREYTIMCKIQSESTIEVQPASEMGTFKQKAFKASALQTDMLPDRNTFTNFDAPSLSQQRQYRHLIGQVHQHHHRSCSDGSVWSLKPVGCGKAEEWEGSGSGGGMNQAERRKQGMNVKEKDREGKDTERGEGSESRGGRRAIFIDVGKAARWL
jgi:hypothetical protein